MRKEHLIQVLAAVLIVATFTIFHDEKSDSVLRKRVNHAWCVTDCGGNTNGVSMGYSSSNVDCQNRCKMNNGISCGKNLQNCCAKDSCTEHFYGDVCSSRIGVADCTST